MKRRTFLGVAALAAAGCNASKPGPPNSAGSLTLAEIEARVKASLKLSEIHLAEEAKREYAGTGLGLNGAKYQIKVTQGDNEIRNTWTDDRGGGGKGVESWSVK